MGKGKGKGNRRATKRSQESRLARLTQKQRLLVRGIQEGKSVLQAALAAGYAPSTAKSDVYQMPAVRSALVELMDQRGLGDDKLLAKLEEKLEAKETKFFAHEGQVVETRDVVAHGIQLQALDIALKLKRLYPERAEAPQGPFTLIVNSTVNLDDIRHQIDTRDGQNIKQIVDIRPAKDGKSG